MIYTSYYFNENIPDNFIKVGISAGMPYKVENIRELNPSWNLIEYYKTTKDEEGYIKRYYEEVLDKLNPHDIISKLRRISMTNGGRDIILLCYESPNEFCHRHIVAKWLRSKGYKIEEYYK